MVWLPDLLHSTSQEVLPFAKAFYHPPVEPGDDSCLPVNIKRLRASLSERPEAFFRLLVMRRTWEIRFPLYSGDQNAKEG